MTSILKFIYGDEKLMKQRKRETVEDHNPIVKITSNHKRKNPTTYARTQGFSVRTNRDKYQSVGKLYTGDEPVEEQSGPVLAKKKTPPRNTVNK